MQGEGLEIKGKLLFTLKLRLADGRNGAMPEHCGQAETIRFSG
jgi:hypothetical protein